MNEVVKFKANDVVHTLQDNVVQEMAEVVFLDQLSDSDIAARFKMSKPTFYKLKRTSRFQKALKDYGEIAVREANTRIQAASDKAVGALIDLLECDIPSIRLRAATETIRLAGLGQPLPEFTPERDQMPDKHLLLMYLQAVAQNDGKKTGGENKPVLVKPDE
jgi:hypothetical protein